MNKADHIILAKNAFGTTQLFITVAMAFLAPKASVNVDEQLHYPRAKR
jgi:hypothetical protein